MTYAKIFLGSLSYFSNNRLLKDNSAKFLNPPARDFQFFIFGTSLSNSA